MVARQLSGQGVDSECLDGASLGFHAYGWTVFDETLPALPALRHLELLLHRERAHTKGHPGPRDTSGGEKISSPGLSYSEPSGFRGNSWVCEFQSAHDGVNACAVPTSGFGRSVVKL